MAQFILDGYFACQLHAVMIMHSRDEQGERDPHRRIWNDEGFCEVFLMSMAAGWNWFTWGRNEKFLSGVNLLPRMCAALSGVYGC